MREEIITEWVPAAKGNQKVNSRNSDHEISSDVQPGIMSDEQFAEFYRENWTLSCRVAEAWGGGAYSKDIAQISLLSLRNVRETDKRVLKCWVVRRTVSRTRSYYKSVMRRLQMTESLEKQHGVLFDANYEHTSDYRPELHEKINGALKQLSEPQRKVLLLHEIAQMPIAVIAKITGFTNSTVKSHAHRARKKMLAYFKEIYAAGIDR